MAPGRQLFGTDGIRGRANLHPMTPMVAMRVGMAVAAHFGRHGRVIVGKDTRLSCYMFENALTAGLCAMGADVMLVGPMPTPGIAYLAKEMRADAGVMVSASHNPFEDNGIKLFAHDGFKLPDDVELELERLAESEHLDDRVVTGEAIGRAKRIDDAPGRYITHVKAAFPEDLKLDGLKIVVDCAHGAAYKIAPWVFAELGAEVIAVGVAPNGLNINDGVGAMHPEGMCALVREHGADLGLALDGDADRIIVADERGEIVDGDALLAICALSLQERGLLRGGAVVATVMSNMGLDRALRERGIELIRTQVGDRYVVEAMRARGVNLGGEQSGHIVQLDHGTTGDGIAAALAVLGIMIRDDRRVSELAGVMERLPQLASSVVCTQRRPLEELELLTTVIRDVERELGDAGRVVVRWSGTEAKLRLMVEGEDATRIAAALERLEHAAEACLS